MASGKFQHSFALFDPDGRLIDWDDGYTEEWRIAGTTLRAGMTYQQLLASVLTVPTTREFLRVNYPDSTPERVIERQIAAFGTDSVREYRTTTGRIVRIDEQRTASGGVRRFAQDVTEEKEAGGILEAHQRLEEADSGTGGVLIEIRRNADGSYAFPPVSEGLRRLLDLPADIVGQDAMMIYSRMIQTDEENTQRALLLERSAQTMQICTMEYRIRDGRDRVRHLRQSLMPRRERDGTVVFSGAMRDVTREKDAEDQVEMLRSVVIRSSDSIVIFESDVWPPSGARIIYVNDRFVELFGFSVDDVIGQPIEYLETEARNLAGADAVVAALFRDDGEPIEFESHGKDGRLFWIEARVAIIQRFHNDRFRWVVMSRDISERRNVQTELLRAKEEAEAGNRAKSNFLANMSHELRTPLNAIIGFTELIEQGLERNGWKDSYRDYLNDVGESGRHLLDLINTILDLSKIEAGSLSLDLMQVDICELVATSTALVSSLARSENIALETDMPVERPLIAGDFLKLRQVLLNILSNAIKFTPQGGRIDARVAFTPDTAVITISDTGCGIAAADLERVTLPFVQVETALSRKHPGSGLGLAIARELCGLHRGKLKIASIVGQGTTVEITLPRH